MLRRVRIVLILIFLETVLALAISRRRVVSTWLLQSIELLLACLGQWKMKIGGLLPAGGGTAFIVGGQHVEKLALAIVLRLVVR